MINPYGNTQGTQSSHAWVASRWSFLLTASVCAYFFTSALTLPWANKVWLGQFPPLAIVQIPKAFLKSIVHAVLLRGLDSMGWSFGSASPNYIATHPWAIGGMVVLPALFLMALVSLSGVPKRRRKVAAILIFSLIDGGVTLWFDTTSSFRLYDAWYW